MHKIKFYMFTGAVLIMSVLVFLLSSKSIITSKSISTSARRITPVIIDAGHGSFDGGAVASDGTQEKTINLQITLRIADILKCCGYEVILTRNSDEALNDPAASSIRMKKVTDMHNRMELIRKHNDAILVSVHQNLFTSSQYSGTQVFYSIKNADSKALAECVQGSVVNLLQNDNNRDVKKIGKTSYLMNNTSIPSILIECGFISNNEELAKLKNTEYQKKIAFAISNGIINYGSV